MMNDRKNTADEKIIEQYLNGLEVPKDELTPIERMTLFSQGKEVDRLRSAYLWYQQKAVGYAEGNRNQRIQS